MACFSIKQTETRRMYTHQLTLYVGVRWCVGVCYGEFGVRVPKTTGSAYMYSYVAVGEFVAFLLGWNMILEYVIGSAAGASAISYCFDALTNHTMSTYLEENVGTVIGRPILWLSSLHIFVAPYTVAYNSITQHSDHHFLPSRTPCSLPFTVYLLLSPSFYSLPVTSLLILLLSFLTSPSITFLSHIITRFQYAMTKCLFRFCFTILLVC